MRRFQILVFLFLFSVFFGAAGAQIQPGMEFSGVDRRIYALEVFDDGKGPALYATGFVNNGDGQFLNKIGKWDGTTWFPLNIGIGNPNTESRWKGWSLITHDDGTGEALYVGGDFFMASGVPAAYIARWDGTTWSNLGDGLNGEVFHLGSYDDGSGAKLYAAGSFFGLWAWNDNLWQMVPGSSALTGTLHAFDDGNGAKLYAAGLYETGSGSTRGIGAWDGSSWQALEGLGATDGVDGGSVLAMATYDDGNGEKLYVGGTFQTAGGLSSPFLAIWTGSTWQSMPNLPIQDEVAALTVYDDGRGPRLVAAFNVTNGDNLVAAWDGQTWTQLNAPGPLDGGSVLDFAVLDDGNGERLFAGGSFYRAGVVNKAHYVAQWDGASWTNVGADQLGLDRDASAFATYDDGSGEDLYLGGGFNLAGNSFAEAVARYDGSAFSGLRDPSGNGIVFPESGFDDEVYALQSFDDGSGDGAKLVAGGRFIRTGDSPLQYLATWDGTEWESLGTPDDWVQSFAVYDDGDGDDLYIGGRFATIDGVTVHSIARWDGVSFSSLEDAGGVGPGSIVSELVVFDDGLGSALYVAGAFSEAGGNPVERLARWDADGWMDVGGFDIDEGSVFALAVYDDGSGPALYIAGSFFEVNGITVNGIVRWDGASFSPLTGPDGTGFTKEGDAPNVYDLVAYDAGAGERLYAVGEFETAGGQSAFSAASWDGTRWRPLIGNAPLVYDVHNAVGIPYVSGIFGYDDGEPTLFITGRFSEIGSTQSYYIARYRDLESIFTDGFENGDVSAWSTASGSP